jgi:hypothetical protein
MGEVDKYKKQMEELFLNILDISKKIKIEYIENYLYLISNKVNTDLNVIEKIYLKSEKNILSNKAKILLIDMFGASRKSFYDELDLRSNNNFLESELEKYHNSFFSYSEELKNRMILVFGNYIKIVLSNQKQENLREVYAFYQTMLITLLFMLPESYRNEALKKDNFSDVKQEINILNYNDSSMNLDFMSAYMLLEKIMRDYVKEKYKLDLLFNKESYSKKRI